MTPSFSLSSSRLLRAIFFDFVVLVLVDLRFISLYIVIIAFFLFFLIGVLAATDKWGLMISSNDY